MKTTYEPPNTTQSFGLGFEKLSLYISHPNGSKEQVDKSLVIPSAELLQIRQQIRGLLELIGTVSRVSNDDVYFPVLYRIQTPSGDNFQIALPIDITDEIRPFEYVYPFTTPRVIP